MCRKCWPSLPRLSRGRSWPKPFQWDGIPPVEEAQMEKTTLLDAYLSGPGVLRAAVTGISRGQMVSRPVAGRWSVLEVVCHLVDTDANIAHRIKRVLSEERPVFDRVK